MAKYKPVILVRHGAYNSDNRLSEVGERQYVEFSEKFKKLGRDDRSFLISDPKKVLFLSSIAPRAEDSAKILQRELGLCDPILQSELWSDKTHPYRPEKVTFLKTIITNFLEKDKEDSEDMMIIVTHFEFVYSFCKDAGYSSDEYDCNNAEGIVIRDTNHGILVNTIESIFRD